MRNAPTSSRRTSRRTAATGQPIPRLLAVALLLGAAAAPATAQQPGSDTLPRFELDSMVVSVLRTPVRLGQSAYPVAVQGTQELRQGKTGFYLEEALEGLPGVQVQNRYNYAVGERVTIRGFGSRAQFGVRGIEVVVDGIPATLPDGQSTLDHVDIASLGRVEVLRGPASALYGNAAGGVLRFETRQPAPAPLRQEVDVLGGDDGLLRLQSTTTGTAGETGYVLSLDRLSYNGFRESAAIPGGSYGGAERLHLNSRVEHPVAGGRVGLTLNLVDLDAENPGALPADLLAESRSNIHNFYTDFRTGKEVQQGQLGLTWNGPVGGLSTEAVVYGILRDFVNPIPFRVIDADRRAGGARLLLGEQDVAGISGLELQGGAEIDVQDDDRKEFGNDSGQRDDLQLDQEENVRSTGVFLQGTVPLHERIEVTGGIRYDHFRFEVDDQFPLALDPTDDSGERTMDSWSPTVGLHVEVAPFLDVFANRSTVFQTPTTVELANRPDGSGGFNPNLAPQTGRTMEIGARGSVLDRLSYELTVFDTQLDDELVPFEVPDQPGVTFFRNAGSSSRTGVEALLHARLTEGISGRVSYTFTDAQFDDYVVDGEQLAGNDVPGFAPQELEGSLRYGTGTWYLELGAEYTDEIPVDDQNSAFADSYTLFDVRLGADSIRIPGGVDISPYAGLRNITDELYSAAVTVNAFGGRFFEPGPGRTFYIGLSTGWATP